MGGLSTTNRCDVLLLTAFQLSALTPRQATEIPVQQRVAMVRRARREMYGRERLAVKQRLRNW